MRKSGRFLVRWMVVPLAVAFATGLSLGAPGQLTGQGTGDPIPLTDLVVTGTPIPMPAEAMGASVSVLRGEDVRARGITRVEDALRDVPGLTVVRGGSFGAVSSLFLRGGESDYVLVLVDGVPLNQPGGTVDLAGLTTEDVERIEVVRGPSSALYGSDAVSGVVHIITRRGAATPTVALTGRGGSFGTREATLDLSGAGEALAYGLSVAQYETDGILALNNGARDTKLSGRVHLQIDPATTARLTARVGDRLYRFPTDSNGEPVDINQGTFADASMVAVEVERRLTSGLGLRALATYHGLETGTDDAPDGPGDASGFQSLDAIRRANLDVRADWRSAGELAVVGGVEVDHQRVRSWNEFLSEFGPSTSRSENERGNVGAYLHAVDRISGTDLSAGLRGEENERFGGFVTGRISAARQMGERTILRGAYGTGLKEPTFFETFAAGFATGNPDLDPERSTSWELGVEHGLGARLRVQATWFDQSFEDLIQFTFAPPEPGDPNYFNVAKASSRGIEVQAETSAAGVDLHLAWTWLDTEVVDSGFQEGPGATFVEGEALLRRPRNVITGAASGSFAGRFHWNARARHVDTRSDRDFSTFPEPTPIRLDAFTVMDLGLEAHLFDAEERRPAVDLTLHVENLGDAVYQEAFGFAAPGRAVYVGARLRWIGG